MNYKRRVLALREANINPTILIYSRSANIIANDQYDALEYNTSITGRLMKKSNKTTDNRTYKSCILLRVSGNSPEFVI